MHNPIQDAVSLHIPKKGKITPSGWNSFNAVCCVHNGETQDTRGRAGIIFSPDGGISYHCFNCKFKAGWTPGHKISQKFKKLLGWLNIRDSEIKKLEFQALKYLSLEDKYIKTKKKTIKFKAFPLPPDFINYEELCTLAGLGAIEGEHNPYKDILDYAKLRGLDVPRYRHLLGASADAGYKERLIVKFEHKGKLVGFTARSIHNRTPKYLSQHDANFVFNLDEQTDSRQFVVVVEGPFDAMLVGGIALCGSEVSDEKAAIINSLKRKVIVVPDADKSGADLIKAAIKYGWNISNSASILNVKDIGNLHSQKLWSKIQILREIMRAEVTSELKIKLLLREHLNKEQ